MMTPRDHGQNPGDPQTPAYRPSPLDPFMVNSGSTFQRKVRVELLRRAAPGVFWRRKVRQLQAARAEKELALLPVLCRRGQAGVDVGAAMGRYAVQMAPYVSQCFAFEAQPWQAEYLRQLARHTGLPIVVDQVAVSDVDGRATLRVPVGLQGLSTIEAANPLVTAEAGAIAVDVRTRKLDSCAVGSVGFVKIDVEGHEGAVLEGAVTLLRTQRPRLVVEVENRHREGAVDELFDFMARLGYSGFFIDGCDLVSITEFDASVHQRPENADGWKMPEERRPQYVNNFVFVPEDEAAALVNSAGELLARR